MNTLKNCPKALLQRVLLTALIGAGCLVTGAAYYVFSGDAVTLALSGLVFAFSTVRCVNLYNVAAKQKYEVIEGACVEASSKPFRKQFTVKIMDGAGIETTLRLGKGSKIKIGRRYRFYFKQGERLSTGSGYFDAALSSDYFLGFEEICTHSQPSVIQ
ncbi:MAG: hypothetical protein LBL26_03440 [Peptococcaceae bacterium]|jgi:hypothetical protein|nr:hypothetical protein [Peptococcaceae bacterium]